MRRREERLEFWLEGGQLSEKQGITARIARLLIRPLLKAVKDFPIGIPARDVSYGQSLVMDSNVQDGLGVFSKFGPDFAKDPLGSAKPSTAAVHPVELLGFIGIRRLPLPGQQRTRVQQGRMTFVTKPREADVGINSARVRSLEPLQDRNSAKDGGRLLLPDAAIRSSARISELPYRRTSGDVDSLSGPERRSFLHEAEVLRQVPNDRAEFVAIFRHVPIEMISRLRFVAEKKEILYSIPEKPTRTQTRVHDIAVIRDTASQEIHMVPHRTQSRVVSTT